jgi:hypothetical protein
MLHPALRGIESDLFIHFMGMAHPIPIAGDTGCAFSRVPCCRGILRKAAAFDVCVSSA